MFHPRVVQTQLGGRFDSGFLLAGNLRKEFNMKTFIPPKCEMLCMHAIIILSTVFIHIHNLRCCYELVFGQKMQDMCRGFF